MNYIDILILIPLIYGAYKGFSAGLIIEISTLLALVLGVLLSLKYAGDTEDVLQRFIEIPEAYSYYIAFAVTFLLVVLIIHLLGKLLTHLINLVSLGLFNKLFGTILGMLKAIIVVGVVLFLTNALDKRYDFISKETKNGSLLYYPFVNFANGVYESITQ